MDIANEEGGGLKYALEFMTKNAVNMSLLITSERKKTFGWLVGKSVRMKI